ncbi:hypothetical protein [Burkholderia cenocepacia]|uniref:hypothetical protein n=1 Tax=Burkholderia cenocepacia TaxID=95486 RepID=UPI0012379557|nr:hypothetical protein [Burkholderia cenocepacia]
MQNMSAGPLEAPENPFFQRWQDVTKGQNASPGARLPGFLELVNLLSSDGQSQSANADLLLQLRSLESELHYSRLTAVERERDLVIAQENLKLMSVRSRETARDALKKRAAPAGEPVSEAAGSRATRDLADLPEWAELNAERIVVLPRALSGAKKSQYENPALIMEALEFLASDYREHKCGNLSLAEFNERLKNQPFQLANSVGWGIAGEQGDQYFVRWGKRRVFLDQHLLKGGGREPRYCMRIYFFFDDASGRCVIGSLPHHLANSLS